MQTMQSTEPSTSQPYTILRIKRKRNEEPLDALVIDASVRKKKSRALGVFHYAETIEDEDWNDIARKQRIQDTISKLAQQEVIKPEPNSQQASRPMKSLPSRKFTVVEQPQAVEAPRPRNPQEPPKVIPVKDLEKQTLGPDFKMYDVVPSVSVEPVSPVDPEMEKFLPMLQAYLQLNDSNVSDSVAGQSVGMLGPTTEVSDQDDYVWDVFYHRPATLSEWNEIANVGTLTNLPSNFGDFYDSASDSDDEVDDEADEDSNAEEYYKNDYPDEDSSDEWHEESEYDDMMDYENNNEEFDHSF